MRNCLIVIGAIAIVPAIIAAWTCAVMLLWNALLPALFAAPAISFWQSLGIQLLIGLLLAPLAVSFKK